MSYDRYRHWNPPPSGCCPVGSARPDLKEQVLKDLAATSDHTDQLEILDSFEAYIQRAYLHEISAAVADTIMRLVRPFLVGGIQSQMPLVYPVRRGRPVARPPLEKTEL